MTLQTTAESASLLDAAPVLTATSPVDVGATPYSIMIVDIATQAVIAFCGSGLTCSTSISTSDLGTKSYRAYIGISSATGPPPSVQAESPVVTIEFKEVAVSLEAENVLPSILGGPIAVTASAGIDISPTAFYLHIYNVDTGAILASCSSGVQCVAMASSDTPGIANYAAVLAVNGFTYNDISKVRGTAEIVAVNWTQTLVAFSADRNDVPVGGQAVLTARSPINVSPTPYYIIIFNAQTAQLVAQCGAGTDCSVAVSESTARVDQFTAVVGRWDSSRNQPTNVVANGTDQFIRFTDDPSAGIIPPRSVTQDATVPFAGIPCGTSYEPTNEPYAVVVFSNYCDIGKVEWYIQLQPWEQATVVGTVAEYGLVWERNGKMMPQCAPHPVKPADYMFHGMLTAKSGDSIFFIDMLSWIDKRGDTVTTSIWGTIYVGY